MELFDQKPSVAELLARIEALEAAVFTKATKPAKEAKPEPLMAAWSQWEAYRHGKGWTANARALNMRKLRELAGEDGELALKIVQQSIEFGWRGLFMPKVQDRATQSPIVRHKTAKEALMPGESKLDTHLGWLRQQVRLGVMTADEYSRQVESARERMG